MSLFNTSAEPAKRVSQGQLEALLSIYYQDSLTGMVRLTPASEDKGEFFVLLYLDGDLFRMYQHLPKGYVRHDTQQWMSVLPQTELNLQSFQFPSRFLRPLQIIFETTKTGEVKTVSTPSVINMIHKLEGNPNPILAHFHWPSADGFAFVPGNNLASRNLSFWSPHHTSGIPSFARWPESECRLTLFETEKENTAWYENCLTLGLDYLYEQIFKRYDELVGASMVTRLEDQLNSVARTQRWKISFTNRVLDDSHFFPSLSDMRIAYRTLLMSGQRHISSVVGEKLFEESARAGFVSLSSVLQKTLTQDNIFTYRV
ncbi:MAG: hypothetical protein R6W69_14540 [Anaerolineales bacterium]